MIKRVSWRDIREDVKRCNRQLYNIIEEITGINDISFIEMSYDYGDLIVERGKFKLPSFFNKLSCYEKEKLHFASRELDYAAVPLFLSLSKSTEVFLSNNQRVTPINFSKAGQLHGTFEFLDYLREKPAIYQWNISAGARSVFSLPSLNNQVGLHKLSNHSAENFSKITSLNEHWKILSSINVGKNDWKYRALFFTGEWVDFLRSSPKFAKLLKYLVGYSWQQSRFGLERMVTDSPWLHLQDELAKQPLRSKVYLVDTLKHLLAIKNGDAPGFAPTSDEDIAPISQFQSLIKECYSFSDYIPTMMAPKVLNNNDTTDTVYYSLAHPTLIDGSPYVRKNIITDLRDLKFILDYMNEHYEFLSGEHIKFYQSSHVDDEKLPHTSQLVMQDKNFRREAEANTNLKFCSNASFLRCCIGIS